MNKRRFLSVLIVVIMMFTQIASLGVASYAEQGVPSGYDFDIVLINDA